MRTLILAGSFGEAAAYARAAGLRHHRFASSARAVEGFHAERVVELPGFTRRSDQHALNAIAKRAERRGAERVKDTVQAHLPPPAEPTVLDKLAAFTRSDWLFGDVGAVKPQSVVEREQSGEAPAPPPAPFTAEQAAEAFNGRAAWPGETASEPKRPEPKPAGKPKRTRKDPPPPRRSGKAAVPVTAESTVSPNTDVDDLFED